MKFLAMAGLWNDEFPKLELKVIRNDEWILCRRFIHRFPQQGVKCLLKQRQFGFMMSKLGTAPELTSSLDFQSLLLELLGSKEATSTFRSSERSQTP